MVRAMTALDAERVLEIYKAGLDTCNATFETRVPLWSDWDQKHLTHSRFIFDADGRVMGWVALTPFSVRKVYQGVAEVSIYVDEGQRGKGIGSELMKKVIASSEDQGIWTLFSSVFPENTATLKLHAKSGFRVVGTREKIARLNGIWRDTVLLERRSSRPEFDT